MKKLMMLGAAGVGGLLALRALWPKYDFANKTVLITGGSRGLGLVLARMLVERGARVGIMARDAAEVAQAEDELQRMGGQVFATAGDLKSREDIHRFVTEGRWALGPIDVLIMRFRASRSVPSLLLAASSMPVPAARQKWFSRCRPNSPSLCRGCSRT